MNSSLNGGLKTADAVDIDKMQEVLQDLLHKVVEDVSAEDIETLESIRKIYRKTIPFSKRMYVASYLLAQYIGDEGTKGGLGGNMRGHGNLSDSRSAARREFQSKREAAGQRTADKDERAVVSDYGTKTEANRGATRAASIKPSGEIKVRIEPPIMGRAQGAGGDESTAGTVQSTRRLKVEIPEDRAATVFISIGRGRRVYPRDLVGLLVNAAGIDRQHIGDIRVLSSYSFVQMYKDDAQTAIDKLNGYDYRGKQLAVSYSKEKSDVAEGAETEQSPVTAQAMNTGALHTAGTAQTAGMAQ